MDVDRLQYEFNDPPDPLYKIWPNLFVGGLDASMEPDVLKAHNITHVINCAIEKIVSTKDVTVMNFRIDDKERYPVYKLFEPLSNIIDNILLDSKHKVLVSCAMGINRSMAILVAYMMRATNKPLDTIIEEILTIRPFAMLTNRSFYDQLKVYQTDILKIQN